ncbi:MAG: D-glycerate dehydrogenase [Candidatus Kerfeldbacteria bacterium]|nr:D-glycerate dehydrogenase [Candidatus Kerfeldbacteria bacterium]
MPKAQLTVFITRPIPTECIVALKKYARVIIRRTDSIITRTELLRGIRQADILLPILTDAIDDQVLAAAPKLKLIANFGAGYNNIDVTAATKRGVLISNTPDVLTDTTAELAITLLLAVARRVVWADQQMRTGRYPGWGPLQYLGHGVSGKTLGIIGLGRIGSRVAEIAHHGFGMHILYYTKHKERDVEKSLGAKKVPLTSLLRRSDFVTLHVPLTRETTHLISQPQLAQMKSTAFLINTSRGPVVNEAAVVQAVRQQRIAGAGFDVYEHEPRLTPGLAALPNVVLLPHIGSATHETRVAMGMLAVKNIIAFIKHQRLPSVVNHPARSV